jgi:indolepyruvate ferredoxin oxidoreductase, beta subunit
MSSQFPDSGQVLAPVTNIIVAGLGGQGVLKASDIIADVAFRSGFDVKKSEIHGMSQRGGSVTSDIRFGAQVFSPMVPDQEADYLVVLAPDQVEVNREALRPSGILIAPDAVEERRLRSKRSLNVALLGVLSRHLDLPEDAWIAAITAALPPTLHRMNIDAFAMGRRE